MVSFNCHEPNTLMPCPSYLYVQFTSLSFIKIHSFIFFPLPTSSPNPQSTSTSAVVMSGVEDKIAPGYGSPPWIFKGRALYQLHLVKADVARSYVPKEFRLVEAFGYTLGGFFLANYNESPAGVFDELVVIAGLVWNPPTSCAWAARVLVNSEEACIHGRKDVGLPSQVAKFSKAVTAVEKCSKGKVDGFLNRIGLGTIGSSIENHLTIGVAEVKDSSVTDTSHVNLISSIILPSTLQKPGKWMGLPIAMSLPSFSGHTIYNPNLLKYACRVQCRARVVKSALVTIPTNSNTAEEDNAVEDSVEKDTSVSSILLSKPILALEFSCLRMEVDQPVVVSQYKHL